MSILIFTEFSCLSSQIGCQKVHQNNDDDQYHTGGKGGVSSVHTAVPGGNVHVDCQRPAAVQQRARHLRHAPQSEDQRRRFANNAAHTQNHGGEDALGSGRQYDFQNGPQFSGAQPEAALPIEVRHRLDGLLRGSDDGGQHHDGYSKHAAENRVAQIQHGAEEDGAEQAVDDGGNSRQCLGGTP